MRRDELLNWMPSIEAEFDMRGLDTYAMAVSKATEIIRRDGETIAALEVERDQLRAELASWQKAFGLLTTLNGSMQIDISDPLRMAKSIEVHVRAELAACKEQKDKWIIAAANAENSRDEAWRELDAAVRHCCGNYREGYDAARKGEGE